ncbi:hypothetical protein E8E13_001660 [Curvularia kusanoi]|uniref:Uncharacterized protein n=1 Tax=Curvularia kusanoi TaxID=90978 RepID=A0A9P4T8K1_CURKU|nr:hypothetical protein E8E13_001660 [Curvularia kusanoi]
MDPRYNTYPQRQAQQHQPQVAQRQHQRFSWQAPLETETTAAPVQNPPPQYQQVHQLPQQPAVYTNVASQHNRGFSYAPTPIEHNGSAYYTSSSDNPTNPSSPVFTPIDDRPQSMFNMLNTPARRQSQQAYGHSSHPRDDDALLSPSSPEAQTLPFMLVESVVGGDEDDTTATATPQPQPQSPPHSPIHQTRHARQMSNLAPLNTNLSQHPAMAAIPQSPRSGTSPHAPSPGALPHKAPLRKDTPNSSYNATTRHQHNAHAPSSPSIPYSPHDFPSHNALTTPHAVFSPAAAHGPNGLDAALHQPGQIRHPNMDLSSDSARSAWKHGLCSCGGGDEGGTDISTCLTGLFCPCVLSGRTAYRLSQKAKKADATDLLGHTGEGEKVV